MSASSKLPSYGAVASSADDKEKAVDRSFDAANTYYLQDTSRLTMKKFLLIAVPILGAVLIVGGFALFLLRDFSHLYPGRGGDKSGYAGAHSGEHVVPSSRTSGINAPRTPPNTGDETGDESSESKTSSTTKHAGNSKSAAPNEDAGATCAVHPDCSDLLGNCCPTDGGVMLECCKN